MVTDAGCYLRHGPSATAPLYLGGRHWKAQNVNNTGGGITREYAMGVPLELKMGQVPFESKTDVSMLCHSFFPIDKHVK